MFVATRWFNRSFNCTCLTNGLHWRPLMTAPSGPWRKKPTLISFNVHHWASSQVTKIYQLSQRPVWRTLSSFPPRVWSGLKRKKKWTDFAKKKLLLAPQDSVLTSAVVIRGVHSAANHKIYLLWSTHCVPCGWQKLDRARKLWHLGHVLDSSLNIFTS